ncbi:MAG: peptidoglycan editing factor PgeF [Cycloclasticus sp.]|uniref:peptidoglycan editing factor PgeF n=1 Tax=Cycloclasticus sp. TaxID=2024830 RepID=UPI00257C5E95|nr:peptidoglycan editing factor PgeF [Cycloclasticus sp.]MBV1898404.1 peptidoglycan editing factor PgeF [Cycloclasticus sp.]
MRFIEPSWPAPKNVRALTTCRSGGVSQTPYSTFNLATHVGDDAQAVIDNRALLSDELNLQAKPVWLSQVHGTTIVELDQLQKGPCIEADGSICRSDAFVCTVMTADCLPVLLCTEDGSAVAAVHVGWRGLLAGIIEQAVAQLAAAEKIMAWLGPAIGPACFEVGSEVKNAFVNKSLVMQQGFRQLNADHHLADLYALARMSLLQCGVKRIYGGEYCTYNQPDKFFSYRREPTTGRMASLIWLQY